MDPSAEEMALYNWDSIDCGHFDLNHSEKFFSRRHSKHEKFVNGEIPDLLLSLDNKENNKNPSNDNNMQKENKNQKRSKSFTDEKKFKKPTNLMSQPFATSAATATGGRHKNEATNVPSVYNYVEKYEKKKRDIIKRTLEDEKKKRIFHSRPVPKFNEAASARDRDEVNKRKDKPLTIPITPQVLKKSKEALVKKNKMIEEYLEQQKPQQFHHRDAHVLHAEPFKPKKAAKSVTLNPFNLHVEKRLEERRHFDDHTKKTFEEKKKQEEEARKKIEDELIRKFRKLATFKANPNPFK